MLVSIQGERATGYGVALLNTIFGQLSHNALLQQIAPPITVSAAMNGDDDEQVVSNKRIKLG